MVVTLFVSTHIEAYSHISTLSHSCPFGPFRQGELYFELHRGTYTSHAANKAFNRRCELLLRDVEVAASMALVLNKGYAYPRAEVEAIWQVGHGTSDPGFVISLRTVLFSSQCHLG